MYDRTPTLYILIFCSCKLPNGNQVKRYEYAGDGYVRLCMEKCAIKFWSEKDAIVVINIV
jgi:hypothetical protein